MNELSSTGAPESPPQEAEHHPTPLLEPSPSTQNHNAGRTTQLRERNCRQPLGHRQSSGTPPPAPSGLCVSISPVAPADAWVPDPPARGALLQPQPQPAPAPKRQGTMPAARRPAWGKRHVRQRYPAHEETDKCRSRAGVRNGAQGQSQARRSAIPLQLGGLLPSHEGSRAEQL